MKDCDFIPARYHEADALRRAFRTRAFFLAVMIAAMLAWVGVHRHQLAAASAMLADLGRQDEQADFLLARRAEIEEQKARLAEHQALLDKLEQRPSAVVVFSEISRRTPDAVLVLESSYHAPVLSRYARREEHGLGDGTDPAAKTAPSAPPGGENEKRPAHTGRECIHLSGLAASAPDVTQFAAVLEQSPLFERIHMKLGDPATYMGRHAIRFELRCDLRRSWGAAP